MSPELSLKLAAAVDRLPAFAQSVQKILKLTRKVSCSPQDLVQVIHQDPAVIVKVLRVVNSACDSLPKQISKKLKFGFGDNVCVEELPPTIAKRLGGTLEEVVASWVDLTPVLDETRIFSKI